MRTRYVICVLRIAVPINFAFQFIVIRTKIDEKNGRKVKVSGVIEDLDGKVLAEAK